MKEDSLSGALAQFVLFEPGGSAVSMVAACGGTAAGRSSHRAQPGRELVCTRGPSSESGAVQSELFRTCGTQLRLPAWRLEAILGRQGPLVEVETSRERLRATPDASIATRGSARIATEDSTQRLEELARFLELRCRLVENRAAASEILKVRLNLSQAGQDTTRLDREMADLVQARSTLLRRLASVPFLTVWNGVSGRW